MAESRQRRFFYGYIIVLAGFIVMCLTWGIFHSFAVFFEPVLNEFGWTRAMTSAAYSLSYILFGLLGIPMGRLNDRFGPRIIMVGSGLLLGFGYLLMSQVNFIWQLYLFFGVMIGIGMGATWVPVISTVARWFVRRRGMMTGIVISGMGLGTLIIPPVVTWLISSYGWRTSFILVGIAALLLITLAGYFLRRDPVQMGQSPYGENEIKEENIYLETRGFSLREAVYTRQFWLLCGMFLITGYFIHTILVHIVIHATGLGISATNAANILATMGGVSILGMIIMGSVGDKLGNRLSAITCFIIIAIILFWLIPVREAWMLYLLVAIFGFGTGGLDTLLSPIVAELFGLTSHGVIMGIIIFSLTIGGAIGPVLAGHIFDITNSYQLAFLITATTATMGAIMILLLRPIRR
ncbi:MFS transporter [Chloroflexota bacterium]